MKNAKHKNINDQSWQGNVGKLVDSLRIPFLLFSHWVVSNSLRPRGLQHTSLPCPLLSPRVCSNSCPLILTISSPVTHFSFCLFPNIRVFSISQLFVSVGQSNGASASASVLSLNIQGWFPLGLTGLISLLSKGLSRVFSNSKVQKNQSFGTQPSLWSNSHIHTWLLEKP